MDRRKRLARIAKILQSDRVADQDTLGRRLAKAGCRVSQASLSRDLRHLGAQRIRGATGEYYYALPQAPPGPGSPQQVARRFAASVREVRRCQCMVLLFTPPGEASGVGQLVDHADLADLVGTIAGDDTLLCIAEDLRRARRLEKQFKEMIA